MDTRKIYNRSALSRIAHNRVRFGKKGSIAIDQTSSMHFNIDPSTGRPMTEIERLVRIQDSVAQQALFSQLSEFKSQFLPVDCTDEAALMFMKSRHVQTKSELLAYKDNLAKYQLNKAMQENQKKMAAAKAEQDKKDYEELLASFRQTKQDNK